MQGAPVIQTILTSRAAYWFKETIESAGRSTPDAPVLRDTTTQCGLYFVDSANKPPAIQRVLIQYILSDPFIKTLRSNPVMARSALLKEHRARWASPRKPYGLEIALPLETTPRNDSPHAPEHPDVFPPFEALHAPTVTPVFPPGDNPEPWKATISVTCGFGTFPLEYSAQWINDNPTIAPHAVLTFADQQKSASRGQTTLTFKPLGSWKTYFRLPDLLPVASAGKLEFIVTGQRGGESPTELLHCKLDFDWKLIPLSYTDDNVITQPWANMPM